MIRDLVILGSTGSIGTSTLNVVRNYKKKFRIKLLTTNNNINKILSQATEFKVKNVIIINKKKYLKYKNKFKKKKINVFFDFNIFNKIIKKKKVNYTINAISGLNGLEPTLKIIKFTNKIAIANKESIICAWDFINKKLIKYNTKFIPIDSEHYSAWSLLNNENIENVDYIILTASGGPFLKKNIKHISNIKPKFALKHPNWKMGKKISIDSATMMNKIFEVIEAKKIFNLDINKFKILIHSNSYIHSIVKYNTGLIKLLAHDSNMEIPIANSLHDNEKFFVKSNKISIKKLNNLDLMIPNQKQFPLLKLLKKIPNKSTYFETILITINDYLVEKYLKKEINYSFIHKTLLKLMNKKIFKKYFNKSPNNLNDIKLMIKNVKIYLNNYLKKNEN